MAGNSIRCKYGLDNALDWYIERISILAESLLFIPGAMASHVLGHHRPTSAEEAPDTRRHMDTAHRHRMPEPVGGRTPRDNTRTKIKITQAVE
jgi:hypothetical protein